MSINRPTAKMTSREMIMPFQFLELALAPTSSLNWGKSLNFGKF